MTRVRGARLLAGLVFFGLLVVIEPAIAQEATDASTAEVLFNDGRKLMGEHKFDEACPKLQESLRLDPGIGVALYLGECYVHAGKTASAWGAFREAAALAKRAKDPREKVAQSRAAAIEPSLFKLTIVVPPAARVRDLAITRDGVSMTEALWGTAFPVDPGNHTIVATAPGRTEWTKSVTALMEGGGMVIEIPVLDGGGGGGASVVTPPPPPPRPPEPPPPRASRGGGTQRVIGLGLVGLGLVGVGIGSIFGFRAMSKSDDLEGHCNGTRCDSPQAVSDRESARSSATVATIAFVAGGALAAGGAVLFFTASSETRPTTGARTVKLVAAPSALLLSGSF